MTDEQIDLYQAVEQMKAISQAGGTFAVKFRKWDRQRLKGGDLCHVAAARLRSKAADEQVENSSYKLFFVDTETGQNKVCWQPLIVEFNGKRTILN